MPVTGRDAAKDSCQRPDYENIRMRIGVEKNIEYVVTEFHYVFDC